MTQLTNTRIYGNLNVDAITTLNGDLDANGGINVTPLKNSTNTVDNSAKITLNSKIVVDKQNSANNEKKLSSIKLSSEDNSYGKIERGSMSDYLYQTNSLYSYTAEIKNNAGALLSLDLHKVNSEEHKAFDNNSGSVTKLRSYDIDRYDTLYNISVNVSDFYKASNSESEVIYDGVESFYSSVPTEKPADAITTEKFRGYTNTTKSTVNVQLTVPYEGGEIITNKTCDDYHIARQFSVKISNTEQLRKLLDKGSHFKILLNPCIPAPGVILYASLYTTGTLTDTGKEYESANPVTFYFEVNGAVNAYYFSSGKYESLTTLRNGQYVYMMLSTKSAADLVKEIIA